MKRTYCLALTLWLVATVAWTNVVAQHVRVNGQTIAQFVTATITTATVTTLNVVTIVATGATSTGAALAHCWTGRACLTSPADGQVVLTNNAASAGFMLDGVTDTQAYFKTRSGASDADLKARSLTATVPGANSLILAGGIGTYRNVTTAGWGVTSVVAQARVVAATNTGTASVATYTVGAADGTFEVGCNVLVTTSTNHTFSCDTTYTDESNVARTMVMPVEQLAGTFATSGLITNVTGAGPYESAVMTIRAKAATAIVIRTSAGGTFTGVVYNIDGTIKQVG